MYCHETEHYIFHCARGSKAEQDIKHIAATQEAGFKHIAITLGLSMKEKIHYYFYNSCDEIGRECERRFGEYTPYNACTVSKNEILAVYNEDMQCIGLHEDTHLFTFTLGYPKSNFLEEGVACAMERLWWGIDNNAWVAYYRKNGLCPSVNELINLSEEEFYALDDLISYPLSGSFISYLLMCFGKDKFFQFYMADNYSIAAKNVLGCSLNELEKDFFRHIDLLNCDETLFIRITELLKE